MTGFSRGMVFPLSRRGGKPVMSLIIFSPLQTEHGALVAPE